jgi:PmbA protein
VIRTNPIPEELIRIVVGEAMRVGAGSAEVQIREGRDFSTVVRLGEVEKLAQSSSRKLGMRIFHRTRSAIASTSDFSADSLLRTVRETWEMARASGEDPAAGIPEPREYERPYPPMEVFFPAAGQLSAEEKITLAHDCEQAAFSWDPRIDNSEGAGFSDTISTVSYGNSAGCFGTYRTSTSTLYASPLATSQGRKEREYWLAAHPDLSRLPNPREIGAEAARRVLRRLGARRVETCSAPVIFDPRTAATLLKHVADAISGHALVRRASFLVDKLNSRVASPLVTIHDDPLMPCGLGSRPFDAEGVPSRTTTVIRGGILENYLLDSYSARRLGLRTTANSNRPPQGGPAAGPSNFYLQAGEASPEEIIGSVPRGLYVTELIGFGVNLVSGNFSQGAAGLWIEGGNLAFPVEGITIAGNLKEMLTSIEAVGNDLLTLGETFSPTLLIGKMVISGS